MTYLGFTGSRAGMTPAQKATVTRLLTELQPKQAHHGDCMGSDADFHELVRATSATVILHPPDDPKDRANCTGDKVLAVKPYLARNKDIVNSCVVLIAAPDSDVEKVRSGTWSTVRYGRKERKRVLVVVPDGTVR